MVVGSNLDPFQGTVALATIVNVAHVIPEEFSVYYVAGLELGKIEGSIRGFRAVSVGVSGFGDNFA